uniref:Uncharacterized protein n=1 Tax=Anopheles melas TaxID=34690 RepID=A0A182TPW5_9DIPT
MDGVMSACCKISVFVGVQHGPPKGNDPSRRILPHQRASQPRGLFLLKWLMFPVFEACRDTPVRAVKTMVNDFTNTTVLHIHTCASVCVCVRTNHRDFHLGMDRNRESERDAVKERLFGLCSTKSQQLFFLQADLLERHSG